MCVLSIKVPIGKSLETYLIILVSTNLMLLLQRCISGSSYLIPHFSSWVFVFQSQWSLLRKVLFSEIQSPKRHLNCYIMLVFCKTPIKGDELLLMTKLEVLNLL